MDSMSGSETIRQIAVSAEPLDVAAAMAAVRRPDAGAVLVFLGTARDHSEGKEGVTRLDYEVYPEHVERVIGEIVAEACEKWPLTGVVVHHREGTVPIGDPSVVVAVSSAHRADAFDGGRYVIDELKERAPIWKREHWPGGAAWVEGA